VPIIYYPQGVPGGSYGTGLIRQADRARLDHADMTFRAAASVAQRVGTGFIADLAQGPLPADEDGLYEVVYPTTPPAQFLDGSFILSLHDLADGNKVVATFSVEMLGGTNQPARIWQADAGVVAAGTSASRFTSTSATLNARTGAYNGMFAAFNTGNDVRQRREIASHAYSNGTHTFTLKQPLTNAPAAGDVFYVG
jgi:hypothetical protein